MTSKNTPEINVLIEDVSHLHHEERRRMVVRNKTCQVILGKISHPTLKKLRDTGEIDHIKVGEGVCGSTLGSLLDYIERSRIG